jgi:hypothetical protein
MTLTRDRMWLQVMSLPVVPIVMGSGDYSKVCPPKSYIDVNDFASAKELANYLLYLGPKP